LPFLRNDNRRLSFLRNVHSQVSLVEWALMVAGSDHVAPGNDGFTNVNRRLTALRRVWLRPRRRTFGETPNVTRETRVLQPVMARQGGLQHLKLTINN
jgi:hypothetical protein